MNACSGCISRSPNEASEFGSPISVHCKSCDCRLQHILHFTDAHMFFPFVSTQLLSLKSLWHINKS